MYIAQRPARPRASRIVRLVAAGMTLALVAAACGGDDGPAAGPDRLAGEVEAPVDAAPPASDPTPSSVADDATDPVGDAGDAGETESIDGESIFQMTINYDVSKTPYSGLSFEWNGTACTDIPDVSSWCNKIAGGSFSMDSYTSPGWMKLQFEGDHDRGGSSALWNAATNGNGLSIQNTSLKYTYHTACSFLSPIDQDGRIMNEVGAPMCVMLGAHDSKNPWSVGGPNLNEHPVDGSTIPGGWGWSDGTSSQNSSSTAYVYFEDHALPVQFHDDHTLNIGWGAIARDTTQNDVVLMAAQGDGSPTITSMDFEFDGQDFSISSGKTFAGVDSTYVNGVLTISAYANRHKTSSVADWFYDRSGGDEHHIKPTQDNTNSKPSQLNFAFCGTLTVEYDGAATDRVPICLGQGHDANPGGIFDAGYFGNNWWIGGSTLDWSLAGAQKGCADAGGASFSISQEVAAKESTTRNETFLVVPAGNPGTYWVDGKDDPGGHQTVGHEENYCD